MLVIIQPLSWTDLVSRGKAEVESPRFNLLVRIVLSQRSLRCTTHHNSTVNGYLPAY